MAVTNPKQLKLTAYAGNTYSFLFDFVDSGGSDIDLSSDYNDIQFRIYQGGKKDSLTYDLKVSGGADGSLSIANTNELTGSISSSDTDSFDKRNQYWELVFTLSDGSLETYVGGRFIINDVTDLSGEIEGGASITINQSTNSVTVSESIDAAAKATQAKVDAEAAASGVNLPSITSGDASKLLQVKGDESGYELIADLDQPTFKTSAKVEEQSSDSGHTVWEFTSAEPETENFIFHQQTADVNASFTRKNVVWVWGYNQAAGSTRFNDAQAGLAWRMESFYEINGVGNFEVHLQSISPNGVVRRPISVTIPQDESESRQIGFNADDFRVVHTYDDNGTEKTDELMSMKKSTQRAFWKYGHTVTTTDISALSQHDSSGNQIPLLKINADDRLQLADLLDHIIIPKVLQELTIDDADSAGSANLTFAGGNDAKIFTEGATNLIFYSNGAEAFRVSPTQNVAFKEEVRISGDANLVLNNMTIFTGLTGNDEYVRIKIDGAWKYLRLYS